MPGTAMQYKDPAGGVSSSVGAQQRTNFFKRKALAEVAEELYFGQFADKEAMPRHYGKELVQDHYLPILHDGNFTDQGIDAAGATIVQKVSIQIVANGAVVSIGSDNREQSSYGTHYAVGEGATAALALTAAEADAVDIFTRLGVFDTDYATTVAAVTALTPAWIVVANAAVPATGNLWGSSRDVGTITGKMPSIGENGGRLNRVGMTRKSIKSKLQNLGIFMEYTADSYDFDDDAMLEEVAHREMLRAAAEIQEDALQADLLNSAGLIRFGGDATAQSEITGETAAVASVAEFDDLMRMDIDLTNNRAPKKIKAILGSRNIDTRTVDAARVLIVGSEMIPTLKKMVNNFGTQAFIHVREYADAQRPMNGEIGAIDGFRIIVSPRMMHWAGEGAPVVANAGYRSTNGFYDVYPMLAMSMGAFSEVSFHSSNGGKAGAKWNVMHQAPGLATMDHADPYGKKGRRSIQWWYGSLITRPEWIGLFKVAAKL